ncbi:MAG: hypothetical protein QW356_04070 [Candidatus Hadarchaeales archaeon]
MKMRRKFGWGGKEPCLRFCWTDGTCIWKRMAEPVDHACHVWSSNGRKKCDKYLPMDPNRPLEEVLRENPSPYPLTVMLTEDEILAFRKVKEE